MYIAVCTIPPSPDAKYDVDCLLWSWSLLRINLTTSVVLMLCIDMKCKSIFKAPAQWSCWGDILFSLHPSVCLSICPYPIWRREKTRKKKHVCGATCFTASQIKFFEAVHPAYHVHYITPTVLDGYKWSLAWEGVLIGQRLRLHGSFEFLWLGQSVSQ